MISITSTWEVRVLRKYIHRIFSLPLAIYYAPSCAAMAPYSVSFIDVFGFEVGLGEIYSTRRAILSPQAGAATSTTMWVIALDYWICPCGTLYGTSQHAIATQQALQVNIRTVRVSPYKALDSISQAHKRTRTPLDPIRPPAHILSMSVSGLRRPAQLPRPGVPIGITTGNNTRGVRLA